MKQQVVIIHGGHSFNSYEGYLEYLKTSELGYERLKPQQKWKQWIAEQMPEADVLLPSMPNSDNAVYDEWKLYFEKLLPFFGDDVRLAGHSLGAMFLIKYLNNNPLPVRVRQLILVAGGYGDDTYGEYGSFSAESTRGEAKNVEETHLFHSEDDPVVPFTELAKFQADMPDAIVHTFTDREHFNQPTFPELLELLKQK